MHRASSADAPFLRGIITSREPIRVGGQSGLNAIPAMFVDGRGIWPASEPCAAQARFSISGAEVVRNGIAVDTAQLAVGQIVSVWVHGVVLESCPPQAGASRVVLEDTR